MKLCLHIETADRRCRGACDCRRARRRNPQRRRVPCYVTQAGRRFGDSVNIAKAQQTLNPDASKIATWSRAWTSRPRRDMVSLSGVVQTRRRRRTCYHRCRTGGHKPGERSPGRHESKLRNAQAPGGAVAGDHGDRGARLFACMGIAVDLAYTYSRKTELMTRPCGLPVGRQGV